MGNQQLVICNRQACLNGGGTMVGKKDRVVALSPVLLIILREYWKKYKPSRKGTLYSSRSLQLVLAAAKKRAWIFKPGSVQALRHSFATHLLDKGTDVTMIMKLLEQ